MDQGTPINQGRFKGGIGDKLLVRLEVCSLDWNKWNTRLFVLLILVLAAHFTIYLNSAVKVFPFPYSFKGWAGDELMYNAWQLSRGQNIYLDPAKGPSCTICYDPGFQLLTAPLVRIFGLHMWVGRLVAICGLVLTWLLIFLAAKKRTGRALYGLIAVGLLMATYGAMDGHFDDIHPDSWAVPMGLLSLAWAEIALKKPLFIVPAALAAFVSYFFKQPAITFGVGAAAFLFLFRPRRGAIFFMLLAVLVTANFIIGQWVTHGTYWDYTVVTARQQPIMWVMVKACAFFLGTAFGFTFIFLLFFSLDKPQALPLSSAYAIALPLVFIGYGLASVRWGGAITSNFFPAAALAAILLADALDYLRRTLAPASPRLAVLLLSLLLVQGVSLLTYSPQVVTKAHYQLAEELERTIRSTPGKVLVYYRIAFAYLNGQEVYDNATFINDHAQWKDHSRLESELQNRYFERVILPDKAIDLGMPPRLRKILLEKYMIEKAYTEPPWFQTTNMVIMKRKGAGPPPGYIAPTGAVLPPYQ